MRKKRTIEAKDKQARVDFMGSTLSLEAQDFFISAEGVKKIVEEQIKERTYISSQRELTEYFLKNSFSPDFDDDGNLVKLEYNCDYDTSREMVVFLRRIIQHIRENSFLEWIWGDAERYRWYFINGKIMDLKPKISWDLKDLKECDL